MDGMQLASLLIFIIMGIIGNSMTRRRTYEIIEGIEQEFD